MNAPRLNWRIFPSHDRAPSGKTTSDRPPDSSFSARFIVWRSAPGDDLSGVAGIVQAAELLKVLVVENQAVVDIYLTGHLACVANQGYFSQL